MRLPNKALNLTKRLFLLLIVASGLVPASGRSQVVATSDGIVEFIGLTTWTPPMIQEKLGYDSPDKFHFCSSDLKAKLGFVDASVVPDRVNGKRYTVITVVEPARAAQVQYRPEPVGSVPVPEEWQGFVQRVEDGMDFNGLLDYGRTVSQADTGQARLMADADTTWYPMLHQRHSITDYAVALRMLAKDGDAKHRVAAAMILTNFADRDSVWWALMAGVRDRNFLVGVACTQALITLTRYVPRPINWAPVAADIRHILNGTNLYALPHILETLSKTQVSRTLARPLLHDHGGNMVLAYVQAQHERERTLAHTLLVQLSGQDLGFDGARWKAWIAGIH